jgi:hypothetical protein
MHEMPILRAQCHVRQSVRNLQTKLVDPERGKGGAAPQSDEQRI